jgi:polyhydroxyalkanoate synthesis regulator phasin
MLNEEFEVAKKKKHALDNLVSTGRISQSTYDSFSREIDEAMTEIERQQQALQEKMTTKMDELEGQIKTLEILLASFEIQHVTGELDENVYQRQIDLLSIGLDNTRQELDTVREAIHQLPGDNTATRIETEILQPESVEISRTEVEVVETSMPETEEETVEPPIEPVQAPIEDSQPVEAAKEENEEKHEA